MPSSPDHSPLRGGGQSWSADIAQASAQPLARSGELTTQQSRGLNDEAATLPKPPGVGSCRRRFVHASGSVRPDSLWTRRRDSGGLDSLRGSGGDVGDVSVSQNSPRRSAGLQARRHRRSAGENADRVVLGSCQSVQDDIHDDSGIRKIPPTPVHNHQLATADNLSPRA